jgi:phenylpropionate dioxygenase-like ring-hydroxylating dioxygenase large terminal subunit
MIPRGESFMSVLDHWHPVLQSQQLRAGPVGVRLAGRSLVLFRGNENRIGVLDDICPHRRMRLSLGRVEGGRLQCPYHGWTFDTCGHGQSPGTPRLHAQVTSYDAREAYGAIWVKPQEAVATFPEFAVDGYRHMCTLAHPMRGPLELALDNFSEIEHTATVHEVFGFDPARMAEVNVQIDTTDTTVQVRNCGPCKRIGLMMRFLLGVRRRHWFYSHWTTYFSPVHLVIDHWWADPATGLESWVRWRVIVVLTPTDSSATAVWSFAYARSRWPIIPGGGLPLFHWLMRRRLDAEIKLDVALVEGLASLDPSIEGMKLGRFDRVLGLNRERIERVYRGRGDARAENGSAVSFV